MPLHQSAMAGRDAAPLISNLVLARTIPRCPRAPGLALKAETPKRTPAWGFYFAKRGASIAAGPAEWGGHRQRYITPSLLQHEMLANVAVGSISATAAKVGAAARPLIADTNATSRCDRFGPTGDIHEDLPLISARANHWKLFERIIWRQRLGHLPKVAPRLALATERSVGWWPRCHPNLGGQAQQIP
jgi:hypothetical protein